VHAHLGALVNGPIPIHWRMNDGMVQEEHLLLCLLVPGQGIGLVRRIKRGIGPQGAEKGAFVIWRAPQPAIGQACPGRDRIACRELLFPGIWGPEIAVGIATGASVCGYGEHLVQRRVV
jgi:hypothetical protein